VQWLTKSFGKYYDEQVWVFRKERIYLGDKPHKRTEKKERKKIKIKRP
jgi:hypothetical protein